MHGNTLHGNREIPRSSAVRERPQTASGSPRAYADDERTREVGQLRSTEKSPNKAEGTGGGGGGGKGAGQGKLARAQRAPDSEPGRRAQRARAGTSGSEERTGSSGSPRSCITSTTSSGCGRRTSRSSGTRPPGSTARRGSTTARTWRTTSRTSSERLRARSVPGEAGAAGVHPEGGRAAAAARRARAGRQDRPARRRRGAERDLRTGLPRVLVRIPAGAQPAPSAGRARGRASEQRKVNWVLDADIRSFFDTLEHEWLVKFIEHRVADRARRAAHPEMAAAPACWRTGKRTRSEVGTVQGGSISPLLANIYLHYVFDLWVQRWRTAAGARRRDRRALCRRLRRGLRASSRKPSGSWPSCASDSRSSAWSCTPTRRGSSSSAASRNRTGATRATAKPETFNFLGFTHICAKTRNGQVHGAAADDAPEVAGEAAGGEDRAAATHAHAHPGARGVPARRSLAGHVRYYGVPMNGPALSAFRQGGGLAVAARSCAVAARRNRLPWERMRRLHRTAGFRLPASVIPIRSCAWRHHPRQEPDAVMPPVRICGGGHERSWIPTPTYLGDSC